MIYIIFFIISISIVIGIFAEIYKWEKVLKILSVIYNVATILAVLLLMYIIVTQ